MALGEFVDKVKEKIHDITDDTKRHADNLGEDAKKAGDDVRHDADKAARIAVQNPGSSVITDLAQNKNGHPGGQHG